MESRSSKHSGVVAALPTAAALTLLLARWVPIRFEYRANDLGIVSLTTQRLYPVQQETFWLLFGLGMGSLLTWALARFVRRGRCETGSIVLLEALGAACLLAVLWLAAAAALAVCFTALAVMAWVVVRGVGREGDRSPKAEPRLLDEPGRHTGWWIPAALVLGLLLAQGSLVAVRDVIVELPDERYISHSFRFLGEDGQHLALADVLRRGGFQGRDAFWLYGPLYDWPIVASWAVMGRSIANYFLTVALAGVLGWTILLVFGGALVRRPALVLLIPFLLPSARLRIGIALLGLFALMLSMRRDDLRWLGIAGAIGGLSLLYSQEYGLVFLLVALIGLLVRSDWRGMGVFSLGFAGATVPLLAYYAAHDALGPMLRDLVQYPGYLMAGFGKLPFPAITPALPFEFSLLGDASLELRLGYALPAICLASLLSALPASDLDPRRPLRSLRAMRDSLARDPLRLTVLLIAVFGLGSFRVALGRSALINTTAVLPPAILLISVAVDRTLSMWSGHARDRIFTVWRTALIAVFILHAGLAETASPISEIRRKLERARVFSSDSNIRTGNSGIARSPDVANAARWIFDHTDSGEPVLFLPNDAAYHYLTDRPAPIRFLLGHQIVTSAHRAEVFEDLQTSPPRFILWDDGALRVDGLSDDLVFGPRILRWIHDHYALRVRFGKIRILGHQELGDSG